MKLKCRCKRLTFCWTPTPQLLSVSPYTLSLMIGRRTCLTRLNKLSPREELSGNQSWRKNEVACARWLCIDTLLPISFISLTSPNPAFRLTLVLFGYYLSIVRALSWHSHSTSLAVTLRIIVHDIDINLYTNPRFSPPIFLPAQIKTYHNALVEEEGAIWKSEFYGPK